jgi:hypothetical protein
MAAGGTMARVLVCLCLGLWPAAAFAQESVTVDLGARDDVAALYSFPNNCAEVCYRPKPETLDDTIKKYLTDSLQRDGYDKTTVNVFESDGRIGVRLEGNGAIDYKQILPKYLEAGELGLKGARELLTPDSAGLIPWRFNWRFFLPHGVAMAQHHTVQLLHFPPDTVLMVEQDYLAAATTKRWATLLMENAPKKDPPISEKDIVQFQNIIDIAPIAAPHKDGAKLKGVYSHFDDYIKALLELWLPLPGQGGSRPLVAFGSPVRSWLKATYEGVNLGVPKLDTVKLESGLKVPALGANHPSFIWAGVKYKKDDPFTPQDEPLQWAMKIMQQDLVAACWQMRMIFPIQSTDPKSTLSDCEQNWAYGITDKAKARLKPGVYETLCRLSYEQVFNKSEHVAVCLCQDLGTEKLIDGVLSISDEEVDALRDAIGANETSAEPEGEPESSAEPE